MDVQTGQGPLAAREPTVMYGNAPSYVDNNVLCTENCYTRVRCDSRTLFYPLTAHSSAFDDGAADEEERALTHSLCLAHRSTSERLQELEKECEIEETERSDSAMTMLASQQEEYKSWALERFEKETRPEHPVSKGSSGNVTVESGVRASRTTALLLGTVLEQQQTPKGGEGSWVSIASPRQSIIDSDRLLRVWTNQRDPLAWSDNGSEHETIMPSDSVSRYNGTSGRSQSEPAVHDMPTFLESHASTSDLIEERPLTATRSTDAADRSRQKIAKLTGENYISPDWMWRTEADDGTTVRFPLPSLEPLEWKDAPKPRKGSKQLRWLNRSISPTYADNIDQEIQERLGRVGLI